jgi:protein-L-isoaspartate(D-aspartate) O-methyltransferase
LVLPLSLGAALQYSIAFERTGDHLESRSVLPCGFMPLRGTFAGPVTRQRLGAPAGLLVESAPRPAGAPGLADLLAQPGEIIGTGVRVTVSELHGGLGVWLTMHEPGIIGRLAEPIGAPPPAPPPPAPAAPAPAPPVPPPDRPASRGALLRPGIILISDAHGAATLVPAGPPDARPRAGSPVTFELGAQPFSKNGFELARRVAGEIRDWATAGRPGLTELRVSAYPDGTPRPDLPGTLIRKRHASLVLSWQKPGE